MRAEDRKPSKRVFPLLQNLDLDSVTFDQVQGVGEPITIEDMNEQEMVDLIIVNLARLCVSGEWTGLLEAGGGGGLVEVLPLIASTGADQYDIGSTPPWGGTVVSLQSLASFDQPICFPFVAPTTDTVSAIGVEVTTAQAGKSVYVAIYSQDSNFLPSTRLGYALISLADTGDIYQTSITGTIELTAGQQYWYSLNINASTSAKLHSISTNYVRSLGITIAPDTKYYSIVDTVATAYSAPPATFTADDLDNGTGRIVVGLKF